MIDLLVVGAGPAGLGTAVTAARAGMQVVVVERRTGPVDKACGEGLMPGAVHALDDLGVLVGGHALRGIRYLDGRRQAEALFRRGEGRGVRRTQLQAALRQRAIEVGVELVEGPAGAVAQVAQDGTTVSAAGLTARYLVAADGLHSPIRQQLGLGLADRRPRRFGQRRHYEVAPWTDLVEVHWSSGTGRGGSGPAAEAYVTPVGEDLVGVAVLSERRAPFEQLLAAFPALAARLPAGGVTSVRGAGPLRQRVRARVAGRVLLVGDAAGYVDALTGEGIAVSLACAPALVQCLLAGRPGDYEAQWVRASRRYRLLTESLLWARRQPPLARSIVPVAARLPRVFAGVVDQLAR